MSNYSIVSNAALTATADAIRIKSGSQATIEFNNNTGFKNAVDAIPNGGESVVEVTIPTDGAVTQVIDAGKIYHFTGALTALTVTLNAASAGQLAQYHFDFNCGATAATLTVPSTVTMPDGFDVKANKRYEIDILNGYGAVMSWTIS